MKGSLKGLIRTEGQVAAWKIVVGRSSETVLQVGPRKAHVRWQQTCGADVRLRTIASGSCWCSPFEGMQGYLECRTGIPAAIAHVMVGRRD